MKTAAKFLKATLSDLSSEINVDYIADIFSGLRQDPYVKEGFRYKAISRYRVNDNLVLRTEHGPLFQSSEHNPTHGDIIRDYPEFDYQDEISEEINHIVRTFAQQCGISKDEEILFQAQRITASKKLTGLPAIEGWHQDGTTYIGMMCINRHNVSGGVSQLAFEKGKNVVLNHELQPGELLILDDRTYWHYATPIQPIDEMKAAYRDILILCTPSCRMPEEKRLAKRA